MSATSDTGSLDVGEISAAEDPQLAADGRTNRRRRRFSEGIEQLPSRPTTLRVGRFSEGLERSSAPPGARRVGSFADGIASHPEQLWERRVGSFADGHGMPRDRESVASSVK